MKRFLTTIIFLSCASSVFAAESMLDYFKGRLPATSTTPGDKLPLMQGNGSAIRMADPVILRPTFKNQTTAWALITGKPTTVHGGRF